MRLTDKYTCKGKETYRISNAEKESKALTKLGKLEDIEDEIGIGLITLFKQSPLQLKALATLTKEELEK